MHKTYSGGEVFVLQLAVGSLATDCVSSLENLFILGDLGICMCGGCLVTCLVNLCTDQLTFVSQAESTSATNESVLKVALDHGKASGIIKSHDRVVVCQKVGDSSVVKIIELDD
jgi:hypothetical protein